MKKKIIWEKEFIGVKLFFDNGEWVIVVHREFKNSLMCIVKKYLESYLYSRANSWTKRVDLYIGYV
jgi:hypothetical protein